MTSHTAITDQLRAAGYDPATFERWDVPSDAFMPSTVTGEDGTILTGLKLSAEAPFEEMNRAVTGDDPRNQRMLPRASVHLAVFADAPAIALSPYRLPDVMPEWGDSLTVGGNDHASYVDNYTQQLPYTQQFNAGTELRWKPVNDLRAIARQVGLSPMPPRKIDLITALLTHDGFRATYGGPERPECYPISHRFTKTLVLRADQGPARIVIDALRDAIEHGTLGIGDPTHPLSHSQFIYDTRDESPAMAAARAAEVDWHDARMVDLEPVAAALKAKGHAWYTLGRPGELSPQGRPHGVYYWLNGKSGYRTSDGVDVTKQPYGWYNLEELAAEAFLDETNSTRPATA